MNSKIKGKNLIAAVKAQDTAKLVEYASENKSKKQVFTFKKALKDLTTKEIDLLWEDLNKIIIKQAEIIISFTTKGSPNKSKSSPNKSKSSSKKVCMEVSRIIQASIDIAFAMLDNNLTLSQGLLHMLVFLNFIIFKIPDFLESLKYSIASLCEKMYQLNFLEAGSEQITFNTIIYFIKRTLQQRASKKTVKDVYAMQSFIPKIFTMSDVDVREVLNLYKKCCTAPVYLSMLEGQKIITSILIASTSHITEIQNAIESYLPSAAMSQGSAYGKIYYHAWNHAFKTRNRALKNELEICLQRMIIMAVKSRKKSLLLVLRKFFGHFHSLRKDRDVAKLLYSLFHPILFRFVTNPDGIIRANTTQLFLDIFPLEDPDEGIVETDKELNDQMLLIRDLLIDEFPIVRSVTIIGLCISMSINWEVFSEDMLKTYFKVILNDLSCDSSSSDVRCAVAKGFKVLLENPLIFPTLQTILPSLRPLFHDISDAVRIAFCQLLLRVKKISSIKYYDIVPLDHLLARMEEDKVIAKTIVNLIHNSYFPKPDPERPKEYLNTCVARCIEMIKTDRGASRIFFQHVPSFIDVEYVAQFMIHAVKAVHFYVRNKMMFQRTDLCNTSSESISEQDIEAMEEGLSLHDYNIVSGLIDAVSIVWLSSHHNLEKPENKNLLKTIVAKLSKHLGDLSLFYKLTPVWQSIYYLCSFMPSRAIPTLASLCFYRLKELDSSTPYEEYMTLLECLCNQNESESLLNVLKEWIEQGFQQQIPKATPPATKRRKESIKSKEDEKKEKDVSKQHFLGLSLLSALINHRSCQKIVLTKHADLLQEFLNLADNAKRKIELSTQTLSEDEADFITELMYILLQIFVLLETEEKNNSAKFVEDTIVWIQNKLIKRASLDMSRNASTTQSKLLKKKQSAAFQKFTVKMCKDVCRIISDITLLGYFNVKSLKFLKFGLQLLGLESGSEFLLPISKMLFNHVSYGIYLTLEEKDDTIIKFVPDSFSKIFQFLKDQNFVINIPTADEKEVLSLLAGSLLLMNSHNQLKELVSSVILIATKAIINNILDDIQNLDHIEQFHHPFNTIIISKSGAFLLSIMCLKPKIMVLFLQQIQKYLINSERNMQSWAAICVIVNHISVMKSMSKIISKEICSVMEKLEDILEGKEPLKNIDTNLPSVFESKSARETEEALNFVVHCQVEYKKLKELLQQKAIMS